MTTRFSDKHQFFGKLVDSDQFLVQTEYCMIRDKGIMHCTIRMCRVLSIIAAQIIAQHPNLSHKYILDFLNQLYDQEEIQRLQKFSDSQQMLYIKELFQLLTGLELPDLEDIIFDLQNRIQILAGCPLGVLALIQCMSAKVYDPWDHITLQQDEISKDEMQWYWDSIEVEQIKRLGPEKAYHLLEEEDSSIKADASSPNAQNEQEKVDDDDQQKQEAGSSEPDMAQDIFEETQESMRALERELDILINNLSPFPLAVTQEQARDAECHIITNMSYDELTKAVNQFGETTQVAQKDNNDEVKKADEESKDTSGPKIPNSLMNEFTKESSMSMASVMQPIDPLHPSSMSLLSKVDEQDLLDAIYCPEEYLDPPFLKQKDFLQLILDEWRKPPDDIVGVV